MDSSVSRDEISFTRFQETQQYEEEKYTKASTYRVFARRCASLERDSHRRDKPIRVHFHTAVSIILETSSQVLVRVECWVVCTVYCSHLVKRVLAEKQLLSLDKRIKVEVESDCNAHVRTDKAG